MSKTQRLFQVMHCFRQFAPPVTALQLAQALDVTVRTIYRDIDELRALGTVIDGEAGFGYTLIEENALPPLGFDDDELEALVLGLREVEQIGDPALGAAASSALVKLRSRLPSRQSHRLRHAVLRARRFEDVPQPTVDAKALRAATWNERRISFSYRDGNGRISTREAEPLAIVYFQNSHCLLAFCVLRQGFRAFRLDRMTDLIVTEQSFRPNRVPMLRDCLAAMQAPRIG